MYKEDSVGENTAPRQVDPALLEESLEDLYEYAPCGYITTLPNGIFAKVNQTFLRWTGYQREALIGHIRWTDVLPVAGKMFYETHYAPLLQIQGFANEIAFDLICHDGRRLPVLLNSVQKRDAFGTPQLIRTTIFNATDRRTYERELLAARKKAEQALELRDQFLALTAHELKTPLTALLGDVHVLHNHLGASDALAAPDQQLLQAVVTQTQRLNKMLLSFLDVSRIETGQLVLQRTPLVLGAFLARLVHDLGSILNEREIVLEGLEQPLTVQGDPVRLEQVFQNLLQNALKYSPATTPVHVKLSQARGKAVVTVHDSGVGIPAIALPRVFDRFYRAPNVQAKDTGGVGIGLYVVKKLVALHGGEVTVASAEGRGSTFTVSLPLV